VTNVVDMQVDTDSQITVTSPSGSGTVDVTVTGPGGTSAVVAEGLFTYGSSVGVVPVVTGLDPASGDEAGGDQVVISGSGFTGATDVGFGVTNVVDMQVDTDSQITVTSPSGSGTVDVTVTGPGGTSAVVAEDQFTYDPSAD
jgi:uncharacterized membrane protein